MVNKWTYYRNITVPRRKYMSIAQWTLLTEQWSIHVYLSMISLFLEGGSLPFDIYFFLGYRHGKNSKNGEKNSAIFAIFANNFSPLLTFSPSIFSPFFYCGKKDEMIFAFCHFCHRFFAILPVSPSIFSPFLPLWQKWWKWRKNHLLYTSVLLYMHK